MPRRLPPPHSQLARLREKSHAARLAIWRPSAPPSLSCRHAHIERDWSALRGMGMGVASNNFSNRACERNRQLKWGNPVSKAPRQPHNWAKQQGQRAFRRGLTEDDCPYQDIRGESGKVTFSRGWRNAWLEGFRSEQQQTTPMDAHGGISGRPIQVVCPHCQHIQTVSIGPGATKCYVPCCGDARVGCGRAFDVPVRPLPPSRGD